MANLEEKVFQMVRDYVQMGREIDDYGYLIEETLKMQGIPEMRKTLNAKKTSHKQLLHDIMQCYEESKRPNPKTSAEPDATGEEKREEPSKKRKP